MRRIAIALMSTVSGLVLLFSYHTSLGPGENTAAAQSGDDGGTPLAPDDGTVNGAGDVTGAGDGSAGASATPSPSPADQNGPASQPAQGVSGTFTGNRVQTQWGPVRVRIVVAKNKIVKAVALEYPNENHHDEEINSWAIPQLQDATVQANGAHIDALSGATVTSQGYLTSLQSALDKAHL